MITLHRVSISNVRSLGDVVFEPLIDGGMTALNGPNGSGKSSVLSALTWAIYGATPDGVTQQAMRRQGSAGDVRVVVEFEHDGQMFIVERGLKGVRDTPYLKVSIDGVEQALGKIRVGEAFLVERLGGMDAEAFMTAFVVRQKELDGLVKARPAERRKLIERLAGIDRMSAAVKTAREEENEIKRRLDVLPGNDEDLQAAAAELEAAQTAAGEAWEAYEQARDGHAAAEDAFATADGALQDMNRRVQAHRDAATAATAARHAADLASQQAQQAKRELDALTAAATGGTPEEVQAAQTGYEKAARALQENEAHLTAATHSGAAADRAAAQAQTARDRATRAQQAATAARDQVTQTVAQASSIPDDINARVTEAERDAMDAAAHVAALRARYDAVDGSIKALAATRDNACCPTCQNTLTDPGLLLTSLEETRDQLKVDGSAARQAAEAKQTLVDRLRGAAQQATQFAERIAALTAQAETADAAAGEADRDARRAEQDAKDAAAAHGAAQSAATQAQSVAQSLRTDMETASEALRKARNAADAASGIPDATTTLTHAAEAVTAAQRAASNATEAEKTARVPDEDLLAVQTRHAAAQQTVRTLLEDKAAKETTFKVAEEKVNSAERHRDTEKAKVLARREAIADLEKKTAVRETLEDFRKERIASLAPELSEIATDSITRMTDGKFVAVELDEEFTPVVTDADGNHRPASWLSGGEESAVALALRLAIGEVIAGQQGGLLWMDEPQTAMDAARRPAMMSVIRDLPGRQPILISHVTEATDMVDLVLEVVPDTENGSTIVRSDTGLIDPTLLADAL